MAVTLILAFHGFFRAFMWSTWTYGVTWVAVHTGLYGLWLDYGSKKFRSVSLMRDTENKVNELKEEVRKAKRREKAKEIARELEKKAKEGEEGGEGGEKSATDASGDTEAGLMAGVRTWWKEVRRSRKVVPAMEREVEKIEVQDKNVENGPQKAAPPVASGEVSSRPQSPRSITFGDQVRVGNGVHARTPERMV